MTRKYKPIADKELGEIFGGVSPLFIASTVLHGDHTTKWVIRQKKTGEKIRIKDFAKADVGLE